jgi:hypothetical protein
LTAGRDNGRRRPVGYAPWEPRGPTLAMLEQIDAVLDDLADYWPITGRQILYRLMGRGTARKADGDKVYDLLTRGRRSGRIPWEAIGDGRTEKLVPVVCTDPEAFRAEMRASASVYRLDRQAGQPVYLEVFVEAAGAVEQVYRTTGNGYGIPVYSGAGFNTVTALREIVLRAEQREQPTTVLVLGDYDWHGEQIRKRVAADVEAFAEQHDVEIEFHTIALTRGQIEEFDLIKQGPEDAKERKKLDNAKRRGWPHDWTVQLEAMSPDDLAAVLVETIEDLTDDELRQAVLAEEAEQRAELMRQLEEQA